MIEVSFVSKLMATVDPNLPVWDKYVLNNVGKNKEWERLRAADPETRIAEAGKIYLYIQQQYKSFLQGDEGKKCIETFDTVLPTYKDKLTDIKKIDFMLWSERQ